MANVGQNQERAGPIRVLVVDDERPTRLLMEKELPRAGYVVTSVESGEEALEQVRARDFDVILLDLKMPGIGGMEALRRIRDSGASAEVVVLTGHPDVDSAIQAMKLGAYDYLTKPLSWPKWRWSCEEPRRESDSEARTPRCGAWSR